MGCNCKKTIVNWEGGDIPNPSHFFKEVEFDSNVTFDGCANADGTHDNPIAQGKVQCVSQNNVLRVHNIFEINGTLNNSGTIYFSRDFIYDPNPGTSMPVVLMEI